MSEPFNYPRVIGQAIFYSSIQASLGSVEMSSRFSVVNFSKDQETLDNAASALKSFMYVAFMWALATVLVLYSSYGTKGAIIGFIANLAYIAWIYLSYINAFHVAALKYGLKDPVVFGF